MNKRPLIALIALLCCAGAQAQIVVGQTTGVTGNSAANVKETSEGARLWLDSVNAKGGVNGQKVELVTLDDQGDAKKAAANARELIEKRNVIALFMIRGTPQNEAVLPLLEQHGVPLVAPSTGAMVLHTPVKKHVFNVRSSYQDEAEKAVRQLASMGVSRIAVLKTQDSFGDDTVQGAERGFKQTQLKPVFIEGFDKAKPDFGAAVPKITAADTQAVLVLGTGAAVVKATHEIRQAGSKATIVTLSNNASGGFIRELGADARGVVVTQVFPNERSLAVPMIKEAADLLHAKAPGESLTPAMIEGYAGAKVLVEGLRHAGPQPTRASLQKALEDLRMDLGGLELHYTPQEHDGVKFTDLSIIGAQGGFVR
jgi:ABC-type branched-subunit amino acid transport system substrate-binding protein